MPQLRRKLYLGLSLAILALPVGLAAAVGAGKVSMPTVEGIVRAAMIRPLAPNSTRQTLASPTNLRVGTVAQTSIAVSWTKARSQVAGYKLYADSALKATTTSNSYTFVPLTCGTAHTLGVSSFDRSGNLSPRRSVVATTAACAQSSSPPAPPAPPAPLTPPASLTVTGATTTSVAVTWAASTGGPVAYGAYLDGAVVGAPTSTSFTFTGLLCGTTHRVAIDAVNAAGNRSAQTSANVPTAACGDTTKPSMPANLSATSSSTTTIGINWTASTDNTGVTGYNAYVNGVLLDTLVTPGDTFAGLTCGTSYTLSVDAHDAAGNVSPRANVTASTSPCVDTAAPSVPGSLHVTASTATSITVAWTGSTDNVGVAGYDMFTNGTGTGGTAYTSATQGSMNCGTSYTIGVDAYDGAGNKSARASVTASTAACATSDTSAPSVPGSLHVTASTATSITVAWTGSTDNVGVAGYDMFTNGTGTGGTTYTSATQGSMNCGTSYTIGVDAYDAAGNKSARASVTASTAACAASSDTTAPSVPGSLNVTASTATSITLAWNASTDNVGVAGYDMFTNGTGTGGTTYTSATQGSMNCGTSYTIGVDAYDAAGNKSARASVTASTAACAAPPPPPPPLGCFSDPYVLCGFTDTAHAGVPAGTVLTPSGNITVSTPGTVINALDVTGRIQVNANNVTIENTRVTQTGGFGVNGGIAIAMGVTGTKLSYDEVRGAGPVEPQAIEQAVSTLGTGTTADHMWLHNCGECWVGQGDLTDSYIAADGTVTGAHYEDAYVGDPGNPGAGWSCNRCTLLNPHEQTAILFTDTSREPGSHGSISNSLIAGGGWSFYTTVNLTNVRMARCLTTSVSAPNGGRACSGGQDSHGYWPGGGYFGPTPNCSSKNATWTNVVWDDNSQPVGC